MGADSDLNSGINVTAMTSYVTRIEDRYDRHGDRPAADTQKCTRESAEKSGWRERGERGGGGERIKP